MEQSPGAGNSAQTIKPATPLARKLVRYIIGFGVGVGVGLAPYLGILNVPLFKPLLSLIPDAIQNTVIPLSAALMGVVAVVVQWYGSERLSRLELRKTFTRTLIILVVTFITLVVVHTMVVVSIPIEKGESLTFLVGFTRPNKPPCTAEVADAECIKLITSNPEAIESFWGDRRIRMAKIALMFSYLIFTASFGAMVGLIVLKEK